VSTPRHHLPFDPDTLPGAPFRFLAGIRAAVEGVRVVLGEPRLRLLAVVPMAVHLLLFAGLLTLGVASGVEPLAGMFKGLFGEQPPQLLAALARGIAWFAVLAGSFLGTVLVGNVVCDPFYDLLSARAEELLLGRSVEQPMTVLTVAAGIFREALATVVRLTLWAPGAVLLFALSFTPAAVVSAPLSFAWAALFASWEYLSRSFSRHATGPGERMRVLGSHKALLLGFGSAAVVLSLVPFTAPFLVVGATRAFLALAARGQVPSRLEEKDRETLRALLPG